MARIYTNNNHRSPNGTAANHCNSSRYRGKSDSLVTLKEIIFLFSILLVCVLLKINAHACQNPNLDDIEWCRQRVHQFCKNAEPVMMSHGIVSFPDMDDTILLAAARLGRRGDRQFYSDLAAVIIRMDRIQNSVSSMTIPFEITQDVPRHFAAPFAQMWYHYIGGMGTLADVADWIKLEKGTLFSSELLTKELELSQQQ